MNTPILMLDDAIIDRYMNQYFDEPKTVSIIEWINSTRNLRGQRVVSVACKGCHTPCISKNTSTIVCTVCGIEEHVHSDPESDYIRKAQVYKRLTHLRRWIDCSQAKQTPDIPDEVIEACRAAPVKTFTALKKLLKSIKYTQHYKDIWYIITIVDPTQPIFKLSHQEEQQLYSLFLRIQKTWEVIKPFKRKSIISYPFVITELLDMIGRPDLKQYFYLPRFNKVLEYKAMWKRLVSSAFFCQDSSQRSSTSTPREV